MKEIEQKLSIGLGLVYRQNWKLEWDSKLSRMREDNQEPANKTLSDKTEKDQLYTSIF